MKTSVAIQNLKCDGCGYTLINKLGGLKEVSNVSVDADYSLVSFDYTLTATLEIIKTTLDKLGHPLTDDINSLVRKAKSYVSCAIGKMGN